MTYVLLNTSLAHTILPYLQVIFHQFLLFPRNAHAIYLSGFVAASSIDKYSLACFAESPHISGDGSRLPHTAGLSGFPKILQLLSSDNCTHLTPKGLPSGIPGMGEDIDI